MDSATPLRSAQNDIVALIIAMTMSSVVTLREVTGSHAQVTGVSTNSIYGHQRPRL